MTTTHEKTPRRSLAASARGRETTTPAPPGATVLTAYASPVTPTAPFAVPAYGVAVAIDPTLADDPTGCPWCVEVDALATVRIYGQPGPDEFCPVEVIEVCPACAPAVIDRALAEQDMRGRPIPPITVEIAA